MVTFNLLSLTILRRSRPFNRVRMIWKKEERKEGEKCMAYGMI